MANDYLFTSESVSKGHPDTTAARASIPPSYPPAPGRLPPLWLIPRDTLGPRLTSVTQADSLSALLTFSQPLDPTQRFDSLEATLRRQADSSIVPFRSLLPKEIDDSLQKIARAIADSIRAANDTTRRDSAVVKPPVKPAPQPAERPEAGAAARDSLTERVIASRPRLFDKLVLRVDSAWTPEAQCLVEIRGIRSAAGVAGDAKNVLASHYWVYKTDTDHRTVTSMRKLNDEDRIIEIAKMLSGNPPSESAKANARELIAS